MHSVSNSNYDWDKVSEILEKYHPGEWDMQILDDELTIKIIIHYPELIVRNSLNQSHRITDLYFRMYFRTNSGKLTTYNVTRGTLSQAEKQSGHAQSHVGSSAANGAWAGMCLGGGPIRSQIHTLSSAGNIASGDYNIFEIFIIGLKDFFSWESIEGGPYYYMADISRKMSISSVPHAHSEDVYKKLINSETYVDFAIVDKRRIEVIQDDDFLDTLLPHIRDEHKVFRDAEGHYYSDGMDEEYPDINLNENFKGEPLIQKVIIDESEQENERKQYPHPRIAEYVAKKLSRKLSLYALKRGSRVRRESENTVIGGVVVQDM